MPDALIASSSPISNADLAQDGEFSATLQPRLARFLLRGAPEAAGLAGAAFGAPMPTKPLSSSANGARAALWLGPDEWLLLAEEADTLRLSDALGSALARTPHSLVDVSHRQLALDISGRLAARVLTSGCPLDLSIAAFPAGMVARTLFHKTEIVLWRRTEERFHLEVWRSFAAYVAGHLRAARRGAEGLPDEALP